jgi:predicted phage terminase large subunit-like protein
MLPKEKTAIAKKIFKEEIELYGKHFFDNHLKLETPNFHKEIYDLYKDDSNKKIAIVAPRGHSKSTITDLVYLSWVIVHSKAKFVLLVSDTYSQAVLFLDALKAEFESNEKLRSFYGDLTSKNWSEGEIVVNGILIKALGAGMKVRGLKYRESRPDLVIIDDLENDELVENKERREKLERWFNGALIPSLAEEGRVIMIGTILHYDSLLNKIASPDKYKSFIKRTYRAINDWGALWPEHLDLAKLEAIKTDYINQGLGFLFYQEYQNDPITDENRKFKREKIKYFTNDDLGFKKLVYYITIDRAYSMEKTADFTAIIVNGVDVENNWFIQQAERFKGTEQDLINKIFDLKAYYNPDKIGIEQKAFEYTLKPNLENEMRRRNNFFLVEELKDLGRSKNIRIEGLVPRFETGSIYLRKEQSDLVDELLMFPKAVHDDLIDALSYQLEIAKNTQYQEAQQFYPKIQKTSYITRSFGQ